MVKLCWFCAHNEIMRHGHTVGQFLQSVVALLVTVAFSPLVVVAGEPVSHYVLARPVAGPTRLGWHRVPRRSGVAMFSYGQAGTVHVFWRRHSFWMVLVSNPLWIALTAPARWLGDRVSGFGRRGWRGPPAAGVREPRRPKPGLPGGSVALAEPLAESVIARLLSTVLRGPGHGASRPDEAGRSGRHKRRIRRRSLSASVHAR